MKFLVISDLHAQNDVLDKMDGLFSQADGVFFAGDFAKGFKPETGQETLQKLCSKHEVIFAVLGNCDNEQFLQDIEDQDISVQKALVFHEGLAIAGSGGAEIFTKETEYERTQEDMQTDFEIVDNAISQSGDSSLWKNMILISHNPPKGTVCDKVNESLHVGSSIFTDYIIKNKPLAVICGHVHEACGTEKIGETVVINPGALQEGSYAWLTIDKKGDNWNVSSVEFGNVLK